MRCQRAHHPIAHEPEPERIFVRSSYRRAIKKYYSLWRGWTKAIAGRIPSGPAFLEVMNGCSCFEETMRIEAGKRWQDGGVSQFAAILRLGKVLSQAIGAPQRYSQ